MVPLVMIWGIRSKIQSRLRPPCVGAQSQKSVPMKVIRHCQRIPLIDLRDFVYLVCVCHAQNQLFADQRAQVP